MSKFSPIGTRFGKLVLLEEGKLSKQKYLCMCDCGKEKRIELDKLRRSHTRSCGCLHRVENHGKSGTSEHGIWACLRDRCLNPKNTSYAKYGGRGITVCQLMGFIHGILGRRGSTPQHDHSTLSTGLTTTETMSIWGIVGGPRAVSSREISATLVG